MRSHALALLLCLAAPLPAQRLAPPQRCSCAEDDRDHRWPWIAGLLGGGALAAGLSRGPRSATAESFDGFTRLDGRPTPPIVVEDVRTPPRPPLIPLAPAVRVVTSPRVCPLVAVPVTRSRRAIEREKAWWRSLTPMQRDSVDRANVRRRRQEEKQRRPLCLVLVPAVVPAGVGLKVALAAGEVL